MAFWLAWGPTSLQLPFAVLLCQVSFQVAQKKKAKTVLKSSCDWLLEGLPCFELCFIYLWAGLLRFRGSLLSGTLCAYEVTSVIVVQALSRVRLFATPWTAARQASLSITISQSSLRLLSIESVMPSNHLILCRPLLLLPSIFPSIWVFSNESALLIRWPKYWSFSFSTSPSNEYSGLISFRIDWCYLLAVQGTLKVFSSTVFTNINSLVLSLPYGPTLIQNCVVLCQI